MLKEDNLVIGFALGVTIPVLLYLGITSLFEAMENAGFVNQFGVPYTFRARTTALIAICANLLPFTLYSRLRNDYSMRGVLIATGIFVIGWIYFYGSEIFGS